MFESSNNPSRRDVLLGGLGALLPPSRRRESFAQTIVRLSEPESGPAADNLVTNEDSFARVCSDLARQAPPNSAYVGVGPDQNLTYIAHARPSYAFILDFRRRNLLLHLLHKALMTLADDRVGYLERLTARKSTRTLPPNPSAEELVDAFVAATFDRTRLDAACVDVAEALRPLGLLSDADRSALATIQAKLAGPGLDARFLALRMYPTFAQLIRSRSRDGRPAHLLADDVFYQAVRTRQLNDRVIPVVGNFASEAALVRIAAFLRERAVSLGVLYVSDVEFFLLRSGTFPNYVENLRRLPWAEGAIVIRTSTREIRHSDRFPGDSSTTILRPISTLLKVAETGRIKNHDDLFVPI